MNKEIWESVKSIIDNCLERELLLKGLLEESQKKIESLETELKSWDDYTR